MNILRNLKNIFETNKLLSDFVDIITNTTIYKKLIYKKIYSYITNLKKQKKLNIIIETSNYCNAHCLMCPQPKMKRLKDFMSDTTFLNIVNKLKREKIRPNVFILNGFGEPLTDKNIFTRIKILKKNFPYSPIKFYSNLNLANSKTIDNIINYGLDEINISFNGYSPKNYQKIMGINYVKTKQNLLNLIKSNNKTGKNLKIRLSMTLLKFNEKEINKFIQYWSKKVDSVSVNKIHTYNQSIPDLSGTNKINKNKHLYPCKYIWDTITINNKGDVNLCCLDYEGTYNFGNVNNKKILSAYYSKKYQKIRQMHLNNQIDNLSMCKNCYTPYKNGVEWLINKLY